MPEPLQSYDSIRPVAPNLHCVEGEWYDTPFRRRMTLVRLKSGELVVHSAIRMEPVHMAELDRLGRVAAIVVPNLFHDSEAPFYAERYPQAKVYVPAKFRAKFERKGQRVSGSIERDWPYADELPAVSLSESMISESLFVHKESRTLVVTDLAFNLHEDDVKKSLERRICRWNGLLRGLGPSRLTPLIFARDRQAVRRMLHELRAHDFDRVVMSHGRIVDHGGKQALLEGYERVFGGL